MEDLFRIALVRPPIAQEAANPSIDLKSNSQFQTQLLALPGDNSVRDGATQLAQAYVKGHEFVGSPAGHPLGAQLDAFAEALDKLETRDELAKRDIRDAVQAAFGTSAKNVVADAQFGQSRTRLSDSIVAIKLLPEEHRRPIEDLSRHMRDMDLIARLAAGEQEWASGRELRRTRRRSLRWPVALGLESRLSTRDTRKDLAQKREAAITERQLKLDKLLDHHERLRSAIDELGGLRPDQFRVTPIDDDEAVLPPKPLLAESATLADAEFLSRLRDLHLDNFRRAVDPASAGRETERSIHDVAELGPALVDRLQPVLTGRMAFVQPEVASRFTMTPEAIDSLSRSTVKLAAELDLPLEDSPVDLLTAQFEHSLQDTVAELEALAGGQSKVSYRRVGRTLVATETAITKGWNLIGVGGPILPPLFPFPPDARIPHTKGDMVPAGIADLLLIKQQLTGYEGADVAHIENVLRGETKTREHTRREETEVISEREEELITTDERELETTDRFEMSREASETIKEDVEFKAGLKISGKYGPFVEFSASAEGSYKRSKEEATKTASKFSQDVTERSAQKISERVLERTTRRTTISTLERNLHELSNDGSDHIAGVYQWVNKTYQAQMYNYGVRAMFDFMVPEPAAFLIQTLRSGHAEAMHLTKPPEFNLHPASITESNYRYWVKVFGATDVEPPPSRYRTVSADYKGGGGDKKTDYTHSGQLAIEEGYRAVQGRVVLTSNIWQDNATLDVAIGQRSLRIKNDGLWGKTVSLSSEESSIPFALTSWRLSHLAVAIEVKCQRTQRAMRVWQLDTYAKLRVAHAAMVADYEEKLAQLEFQAGVAIEGRNPQANLAIMEDELKKNCISILTDQHFDLFNAIETDPGTGFEQIDVFEAAGEGPYVRFFEQAFEWENISWITYPYFWGRKDQWDERIAYDDTDPAFTDFLRAGFCRVSVPARPGFEGAIDHFLTFGEIWNGGPLPPISSDLYLPIADEIAERLERPGDEVPEGDPWTVTVPTSLVHLRPDDELPNWEQDDSGNWEEA